MSKHQLWYSTKCRFCQAFLEELSKTPLVSQFQLICIDPSPNRPPLPSWLKVVPSLLVRGEHEPRTGPGPVNNWLFEAKLGGGTPSVSSKSANQNSLAAPVYSPDIGNARAPQGTRNTDAIPASLPAATGDPEAYYGSEMMAGRWSDNFSFLDTVFSADKGMNPIERNFQSVLAPGAGLGGAGTGGGAGGGMGRPTEKRSAKEDALLREFEAYTSGRDRDIQKPLTRM
ncbi:MAG: hypothetical protein WCO50_08580 [Synechococcus sp. ELA619]